MGLGLRREMKMSRKDKTQDIENGSDRTMKKEEDSIKVNDEEGEAVIKENAADDSVGGLNISAKTFISTIALLLGILIVVGILTHIIPQGHYQYVMEGGRSVVVPGTYSELTNADPLPVWRWFTAPFEVLGTDQALTAIMIMVFILFILTFFAGFPLQLFLCAFYCREKITLGWRQFIKRFMAVFFIFPLRFFNGRFVANGSGVV